MKQYSRREKVISVLEALVRQEADETARRLREHQVQMAASEAATAAQRAKLNLAVSEARSQRAPGGTLNLGLLSLSTRHMAAQTQLAAAAAKELETVVDAVEAVQTEIQFQQRKLERYADLARETTSRQAMQREKIEEKNIDELWLGTGRWESNE
jgi:hypothetical protein